MKKTTFTLILCAILISCRDDRKLQETNIDNEYVEYRNDDGYSSEFYMDYLLYSTLRNQSNTNTVHHYHETYPKQFPNQTNYSTYNKNIIKPTNKPVVVNSKIPIARTNKPVAVPVKKPTINLNKQPFTVKKIEYKTYLKSSPSVSSKSSFRPSTSSARRR